MFKCLTVQRGYSNSNDCGPDWGCSPEVSSCGPDYGEDCMPDCGPEDGSDDPY